MHDLLALGGVALGGLLLTVGAHALLKWHRRREIKRADARHAREHVPVNRGTMASSCYPAGDCSLNNTP